MDILSRAFTVPVYLSPPLKVRGQFFISPSCLLQLQFDKRLTRIVWADCCFIDLHTSNDKKVGFYHPFGSWYLTGCQACQMNQFNSHMCADLLINSLTRPEWLSPKEIALPLLLLSLFIMTEYMARCQPPCCEFSHSFKWHLMKWKRGKTTLSAVRGDHITCFEEVTRKGEGEQRLLAAVPWLS